MRVLPRGRRVLLAGESQNVALLKSAVRVLHADGLTPAALEVVATLAATAEPVQVGPQKLTWRRSSISPRYTHTHGAWEPRLPAAALNLPFSPGSWKELFFFFFFYVFPWLVEGTARRGDD